MIEPKLSLAEIARRAFLGEVQDKETGLYYIGMAATTKTELAECADIMGYTGPIADLFNTADVISERGNNFETNIVDSLKRAQGIYD